MRTLTFIVEGQTIKADPYCDFSGLKPGTEKYLEAEFIFSKEWDGFKKVASFSSIMGTEFEPQVISNESSCMIPSEALKKEAFNIQVIGKIGDIKLITNKVLVRQN